MKKIISDYEKSVNDLAEKNSAFQFENKGAGHARIVVSAILKNTTNIVYMYSGELKSEVVDKDEFLAILEEFLKNRNITFKLLLDKIPPIEEQSKALKMVIEASENSHIIVKTLTSEAGDFLKNTNHFVVSDEKAYRYEVNPDEYKALCSFNNEKISKQLMELFSLAFNLSEYYYTK